MIQAMTMSAYGKTSHETAIAVIIFGTVKGGWMLEAVAWRFPVTSTVILETASLLRIDLHKTEYMLVTSSKI
jgi:hypothetical protein